MTYKELLSRSEASASYWRKEYESMLESRGKYITAAVSAVVLLEVKADWVKHVLALEHANEMEKLQDLTATMENLVKDVDGCLKLHGWVRRKGKVDD